MGLPASAAISNWRSEDRALHLAGREIVVIIEADFADGEHFGVRGQVAQAREGFRRGFGGVVRMHADGGVR